MKRWDPVTGLVRVSLVGCKVSLILISLGIVMWQGYDVTQTYLSRPISTEVKVVPLSSIPNIRLSICMKFIITSCRCIGPNLSPFKNSLNASYPDYWNYTDLNKTITASKSILVLGRFWIKSNIGMILVQNGKLCLTYLLQLLEMKWSCSQGKCIHM